MPEHPLQCQPQAYRGCHRVRRTADRRKGQAVPLGDPEPKQGLHQETMVGLALELLAQRCSVGEVTTIFTGEGEKPLLSLAAASDRIQRLW